jgi:hypothetical protein
MIILFKLSKSILVGWIRGETGGGEREIEREIERER